MENGGSKQIEWAERIKAVIDTSDLWIFGVRALHDDEQPQIGSVMPESYVWDDDCRTDEPIGGTCCFLVNEMVAGHDPTQAICKVTAYSSSGRYALLGGKYRGNNDLIAEPGAVAIRDAVVLAVW